MNAFEQRMSEVGGEALRATSLDGLVVSVTLRCNQSCRHCHVRSGPERTESMGDAVMAGVLEAASAMRPAVVDVTGGSPELNPLLPDFLRALASDGHAVQVRTNLTVLDRHECRRLADVYAECGVALLASMPCYTRRNAEASRGAGVLDPSVRALRRLNDLGFGVDGGRRMDLVYNPVGTNLPEPQVALEAVFREQMTSRFGVSFTHLLTMTNMPVGRFRDALIAEGAYDRYMRALRESFNPEVVPLLQCRHQVEVGWDGRLYDCDFNLGEDLPIDDAPGYVWEFDAAALSRRRVVHRDHCLGCTAGAGSS